jgi:formate hydrogenlyase subunit 3/multisubunit Na+/H+ antiporter MnhD subunit
MTAADLWGLALGHAPALAVTVPLAAAILVLSLPGVRMAYATGLAGYGVAGAAAAAAFAQVLETGPVSYSLAADLSWRVDAWSAGLVAAAFILGLPALFTRDRGVGGASDPPPPQFALAAVLTVAACMTAVAYASHLALLVVALQAAGLAMTVLAAVGGANAGVSSLNAALRTLLAFGLAGAVGWFGVALALSAAGVGDMALMAGLEQDGHGVWAGLVLIGLAAGLVGLAAPLDHWGAAVLTRGSQTVALAAVAFVGPLAFVALARMLSVAADLGAGVGVGVVLIVLGGVGAVAAAVQALAARDLRRLAGYAFAAQLGCALVGLGLSTPEGAAAAALKLLSGALAALLLISAAGVQADLNQLDGLARRAPLSALNAALGSLLLMSAPFTLGYAGAWTLVEAALARGWWMGAALTVAVSLAGVVFGGRLLERIYFRAPHGDPEDGAGVSRSWGQGMGMALLAALAVVLGFAGGVLADWAEAAGRALWAWPFASLAQPGAAGAAP